MNPIDCKRSIEACAAHYGDESEAVRQYMYDGLARAEAIPNRGPILFTAEGRLAPEIRSAYSEYGFYIFEDVVGEREMGDILADLRGLRARFPTHPGSELDAEGRPALGVGLRGPGLAWAKSLGDPLGGTQAAGGRHKVKVRELEAAADAPAEAPFILFGSLQFSDAALRLYGQPDLLRVAAEINGDDFAPFTDVLFIKDPGRGAAVSWHQDGDTHWNAPDLDEDTHGFNFMAQVYGSTPVNGVWVLPGSHRQGQLDVAELVKNAGTERLPEAVPLVCNPGEVVICNRQLVHGSFPNAGFEPRLTINFGFHRRKSVLDVQGTGVHSPVKVYDDATIARRTRALGFAIEARRLQYPDETPYEYRPFAERGETFEWNESARTELCDYNLLDLSI
ncbi:MAG: phytanoyl-CoA dioxygenase [bacterium TMED88]|nr:phytanoyl-CoA dioxygenase [Deltaproteobacteria bacterium]OUV35395.1 MAG: phytanoyl-CoA dioxygenase [bacterium TMED88]